MDIKDCTVHELEEEITRRKKCKNTRPVLKNSINLGSVKSITENIMTKIAANCYEEDNDDAHYIFEEVLKALYGDNVFDWINENTD